MIDERKSFELKAPIGYSGIRFPLSIVFSISSDAIIMVVKEPKGKSLHVTPMHEFVDNSCTFNYDDIIKGEIQVISSPSNSGTFNEGKNSFMFDIRFGEFRNWNEHLIGIYELEDTVDKIVKPVKSISATVPTKVKEKISSVADDVPVKPSLKEKKKPAAKSSVSKKKGTKSTKSKPKSKTPSKNKTAKNKLVL